VETYILKYNTVQNKNIENQKKLSILKTIIGQADLIAARK
jgi:hypothetical protein